MSSRQPLPTYNFALVVVQHPVTKRFLLVEESRNRGWWLPGGRVEPGEHFAVGAIRETQEEAGIALTLKGILRIEHTPMGTGTGASARMRVIFFAEPTDPEQLPKTEPDDESLQAKWVSVEDLVHYRLRGEEPTEWFTYLANGNPIFPLSVFTREIQPVQLRDAPGSTQSV